MIAQTNEKAKTASPSRYAWPRVSKVRSAVRVSRSPDLPNEPRPSWTECSTTAAAQPRKPATVMSRSGRRAANQIIVTAIAVQIAWVTSAIGRLRVIMAGAWSPAIAEYCPASTAPNTAPLIRASRKPARGSR